MQKRKLKGNRGVYKCHTFGTLQRYSREITFKYLKSNYSLISQVN